MCFRPVGYVICVHLFAALHLSVIIALSEGSAGVTQEGFNAVFLHLLFCISFLPHLFASENRRLPQLPVLGRSFVEDKDSKARRRRGEEDNSVGIGDFQTGYTYSFSFHSMYIDMAQVCFRFCVSQCFATPLSSCVFVRVCVLS